MFIPEPRKTDFESRTKEMSNLSQNDPWQSGLWQHGYYRIPKALFTEEKYRTLSTDAKMLYGLLLDRQGLSEKNGWADQYGRTYQFFTVQQAQKLLHFGHEKICRLFSELNAAGLIDRKRQGLGKASVIYVKEFP